MPSMTLELPLWARRWFPDYPIRVWRFLFMPHSVFEQMEDDARIQARLLDIIEAGKE